MERCRNRSLIAVGVVAHPGGRVQIDGLKGTHEGPAQRKALANPDINVFNARVPLIDEPEGFLKQRALQAVHDKTVDLTFHHDGGVASRSQELRGSLDN